MGLAPGLLGIILIVVGTIAVTMPFVGFTGFGRGDRRTYSSWGALLSSSARSGRATGVAFSSAC